MATKLTDRLDELESAIHQEHDARDRLREAMRAQGEILRHLRAGGVASTTIALRVAQILGLPLGVESRKRIAAMLRSRTRRHSFLPRRDGNNGSSGIPLDGKETSMAKLLRRTVVTEVFEPVEESDSTKESDESNETDEDVDVDDEEDGEDSDRTGRRGSPPARRSR